MAENMSCTIVALDRTIFSGEATYVGLPRKIGGFGVMKGHEPLVSTLSSGVVSITTPDSGKASVRVIISGGYAEISDNNVIVLADNASPISEIDVAAVKAQLAKVEESLKGIAEGDAGRAYYQQRKDWLELQLKSVNAAE